MRSSTPHWPSRKRAPPTSSVRSAQPPPPRVRPRLTTATPLRGRHPRSAAVSAPPGTASKGTTAKQRQGSICLASTWRFGALKPTPPPRAPVSTPSATATAPTAPAPAPSVPTAASKPERPAGGFGARQFQSAWEASVEPSSLSEVVAPARTKEAVCKALKEQQVVLLLGSFSSGKTVLAREAARAVGLSPSFVSTAEPFGDRLAKDGRTVLGPGAGTEIVGQARIVRGAMHGNLAVLVDSLDVFSQRDGPRDKMTPEVSRAWVRRLVLTRFCETTVHGKQWSTPKRRPCAPVVLVAEQTTGPLARVLDHEYARRGGGSKTGDAAGAVSVEDILASAVAKVYVNELKADGTRVLLRRVAARTARRLGVGVDGVLPDTVCAQIAQREPMNARRALQTACDFVLFRLRETAKRPQYLSNGAPNPRATATSLEAAFFHARAGVENGQEAQTRIVYGNRYRAAVAVLRRTLPGGDGAAAFGSDASFLALAKRFPSTALTWFPPTIVARVALVVSALRGLGAFAAVPFPVGAADEIARRVLLDLDRSRAAQRCGGRLRGQRAEPAVREVVRRTLAFLAAFTAKVARAPSFYGCEPQPTRLGAETIAKRAVGGTTPQLEAALAREEKVAPVDAGSLPGGPWTGWTPDDDDDDEASASHAPATDSVARRLQTSTAFGRRALAAVAAAGARQGTGASDTERARPTAVAPGKRHELKGKMSDLVAVDQKALLIGIFPETERLLFEAVYRRWEVPQTFCTTTNRTVAQATGADLTDMTDLADAFVLNDQFGRYTWQRKNDDVAASVIQSTCLAMGLSEPRNRGPAPASSRTAAGPTPRSRRSQFLCAFDRELTGLNAGEWWKRLQDQAELQRTLARAYSRAACTDGTLRPSGFDTVDDLLLRHRLQNAAAASRGLDTETRRGYTTTFRRALTCPDRRVLRNVLGDFTDRIDAEHKLYPEVPATYQSASRAGREKTK